MKTRIKIRMLTWYWGNFVTFPTNKPIPSGFEKYTDEEHGWQHSEEFKKGQKRPYQNGDKGTYESMVRQS